MTVKRKSGGSMIDVSAIKRKSGGAFVNVAAGWRRQGGAWVQIWPMIISGLVQITNQDIFHTDPLPGAASGSYQLNADGKVYQVLQGTPLLMETWLLSGVNTDYQARATLVSGDTPTIGTLNVWTALNVSQSWGFTLADPPPGNTCVIHVEIRRASDSVLLDFADIQIFVETS